VYVQLITLSITLPRDWFVNPQVLSEFYERFKDAPPEEIKRFSYNQGLALGRSIVERLKIEGDDGEAIAAVLREALRDEPTARIVHVGKRSVLLRNSGFCPLMTAALSLGLPWAWLCEVLGWPFFHGLVSAVNPKVDMKMIRRRAKGDPCCDHLFEVGEGRLILP